MSQNQSRYGLSSSIDSCNVIITEVNKNFAHIVNKDEFRHLFSSLRDKIEKFLSDDPNKKELAQQIYEDLKFLKNEINLKIEELERIEEESHRTGSILAEKIQDYSNLNTKICMLVETMGDLVLEKEMN